MKLRAATKHRVANGLLVICLALLGARTTNADATSPTGRVSDVQGSLAVQGEAEDDVSYAELNTVLREHDTLWTSENSRAEIELETDSWLRLADDTKIEIRQLPPGGELRLWAGSVYLQTASLSKWPIRLKTPAGEVEIYPASVVRVDLSRAPAAETKPADEGKPAEEDESVRVTLYKGRVQVFPDIGPSLRLREGERVSLRADQPTEGSILLEDNETDDFDRYHSRRMEYYAARPLPQGLGENVIGARELHGYGTWTVVQKIRYWRPRCAPGWRPYSYGYWSYVPGYGYTWVDYAPWGYATCHYGRWLFLPRYGWVWRPGYRWAPCHVAWSSYNGYYGWAPLDPWGRPCHYGAGGFHSLYFLIDLRSWTFCARDRFYYGLHHRRYGGQGHCLYASRELRGLGGRPHAVRGFHVVRDVHREIGVPRERVRGIMLASNGVLARERVRQVEYKLPEPRLKLIEARFQIPVDLNRRPVRTASEAERLQKNPALEVGTIRITRGNEAVRHLIQQRTWQDRQNAGSSAVKGVSGEHQNAPQTQNGVLPIDGDTHLVRPRPAPSQHGSASATRPAIKGRPISDKVTVPNQGLPRPLGADHKPQILRTTPGAGSPDNAYNGNENRGTKPSHNVAQTVSDTIGSNNGAQGDRDPQELQTPPTTKPKIDKEAPPKEVAPSAPQKGDQAKARDKETVVRADAPREAAPREPKPQAHQRRDELGATEARRSGMEQPETKKPENDRRAERQAERQQEMQQKQAAQQQEAELRAAEQREARRREAEQRAVQQREEAQRRAAEQREARRQERQQREAEQRDSATGGTRNKAK